MTLTYPQPVEVDNFALLSAMMSHVLLTLLRLRRQDQEVVMDKRRGVIVSSTSLVLQNVTRRQAGSYRCHAVNTEGESTSNKAVLRVMCEYSAGRGGEL